MKFEGVVKNMTKAHGEGTASVGLHYHDIERIPTGVFAFDLASGGGFPRGKISVVYGPESAGKTNLTLMAIAQAQRLYPDETAVFIDVEKALDPKWAKALGVDTDNLGYLLPNFAEEGIDMLSAVLAADDVGLVVVDSVAALTPMKEAEASADRMQVGGNSLLIGSMMRKAIVGLTQAQKQDRYPTIILLNQVRIKIGVMFGNPEGMPGGNALKHASGLTARVYGKNKVLKEVSATLPAVKETSVVINKWKVPIVSVNCEYEMAMVPHDGKKPGDTNEWKTLATYLRSMELLFQNDNKQWELDGKTFSTLSEVRKSVQGDPLWLYDLKQRVIHEQLKAITGDDDGEVEGESVPDDE